MCGIVFVINSGTHCNGLDSFFSDALLASQVRGTDSTGVFQIKNTFHAQNERDVNFFKKAMPATMYLEDRDAESIIRQVPYSLATVGHVRAATQGNVTVNNAHPFTVKREDGSRLIGVHNGTLNNWKSKEDGDKFAVDSEWLLNKLAVDGADAFEAFDGAFALVWYDSRKPDKLFLARNDKRPLYYGVSEDGKVMLAASELGMLGWIADRNGFKMKKTDGYSYMYPLPGHIMEIDLKTLARKSFKYVDYNAASRLYVKPVSANSTPYTPPVHTTYSWEAYDLQRQQSVLDRMKAALKSSKKLEEETGEFEDTTGFEAALASEIAEYRRKNMPAGKFKYCDEPNDRNASKLEQEAAKKIGIYGLCVKFCGYFTDPTECIVYGDFRLMEAGTLNVYDAMVRGMSEKAGDAKYVHPTKLSDMVVIGISNVHQAQGKPYIVLADLAADAKTTTYNKKVTTEGDKQRVLH